MPGRLAVVLFNLGGPDSLEAVNPFLFNLFNDKAIIGLPQPARLLLARLLSRRRAVVAREIYQQLGGGSPLLPLTREQAQALERRLREQHTDVRVFVCMRYWHPMSDGVATDVLAFAPDQIVLLPLYPQFSTTTTASSLADWELAAAKAGLKVPTAAVCCYPTQPGFVAAVARQVRSAVESASLAGGYRILFSAHGLPERVVARGDPYQWQVEQTCAAVLGAMGDTSADHVVCYQSRVGPLKWIGPSTEDALKQAAADGVAAVVVPIAFVSEHSETLVELDIEYRRRAEEFGVPQYIRVAAVGAAAEFIDGLAELTEIARRRTGLVCAEGGRRCPECCSGCPCRPADVSPTR